MSTSTDKTDVLEKLERVDWIAVRDSLNDRGYALIPNVISHRDCDRLIAGYNDSTLYRKTISMERYRFGRGEYKYFSYPLPDIIQEAREGLYPKLARVANHWMEVLKRNHRFPDSFEDLRQMCWGAGQRKPTPLILKYEEVGYNTLHQDLYGEVFFPIQSVVFLNQPEAEYEGGEFVMTEQRPRAQSKAMVIKPNKGDLLIFTTNFRPVKGSKGYYQVKMKHGVSEITQGNRHTLGIIFHDAL
ncbi:MAG: 2OG-Fe(II) oxygenase [Bacteroidota bacterium]